MKSILRLGQYEDEVHIAQRHATRPRLVARQPVQIAVGPAEHNLAVREATELQAKDGEASGRRLIRRKAERGVRALSGVGERRSRTERPVGAPRALTHSI